MHKLLTKNIINVLPYLWKSMYIYMYSPVRVSDVFMLGIFVEIKIYTHYCFIGDR
jgi:hypothetical protein